MAATFSPVNLELNEFEGTTGQTVTITDEVTLPAVPETLTITNVVLSNTERPADFIVTWSGNQFTFISKFEDQFDRTLKFVTQDEDRTKRFFKVNRFIDIPENYKGLYQYVPPAQDWKEIIFAVTVEGSVTGPATYNWTLTLRHNFQVSNSKFVEYSRKGQEYQQALQSYPELSL